MLQFLTVLLVTFSPGFAEPQVEIDRPAPKRVTSNRFESALDRKMNSTWRRVSLRAILEAISREREISILLDRRIDPTRNRSWSFSGRPLRTELSDLAEQLDASLSITGNTVYLGPAESAAKVRTLVRLREDEIVDEAAQLPQGRDLELMRHVTLHWGDLTTPTELIRRCGETYKLQIAGLEQIPHDLWAGGTIPSATAAEALTLVLIQFDLAFEWTSKGTGIRILPAPAHVELKKSYPVPARVTSGALDEWREKRTHTKLTVAGRKAELAGRVEDHESFAALLNPKAKGPVAVRPVPLARQTFTLKIEKTPIRAVIEELQKRGIEFRYDEKALEKAGIDLDTRIDLDVHKAGPEEFFAAICEPLGLKFQIEGQTVTLEPK
jgi:hypothetical protein